MTLRYQTYGTTQLPTRGLNPEKTLVTELGSSDDVLRKQKNPDLGLDRAAAGEAILKLPISEGGIGKSGP